MLYNIHGFFLCNVCILMIIAIYNIYLHIRVNNLDILTEFLQDFLFLIVAAVIMFVIILFVIFSTFLKHKLPSRTYILLDWEMIVCSYLLRALR